MSKGDELYVRKPGDRMSEPEDQMWDDASMTAAYDKAIHKANADIAKKIAMATNARNQSTSKPVDKKSKEKKVSKPKLWKEGMACRAVYSADGQEYEAVITAIFDNDCGVVRFWGYDNTEIVSLDMLKGTRGDEARYRQIEDASPEKNDDGFESQSNDDGNASGHIAASLARKASKKKVKMGPGAIPEFPPMPNMPNLPNMAKLTAAMQLPSMGGFRSPYMAIPPPPPLMLNEAEDEALSAMLISWYMSGYHTGLYQGMKRANQGRRQ